MKRIRKIEYELVLYVAVQYNVADIDSVKKRKPCIISA